MRRAMLCPVFAICSAAVFCALATAAGPSQAQVVITAVDDGYSTPVNTPLNVPAPGILHNDVSVFVLTAELVGGPAHGSLTMFPTGAFDYNPSLDFVGQDSFTYRAFDGANLSNVATVRITVGRIEAVPEPGTYALLACMVIPAALLYRRRRA